MNPMMLRQQWASVCALFRALQERSVTSAQQPSQSNIRVHQEDNELILDGILPMANDHSIELVANRLAVKPASTAIENQFLTSQNGQMCFAPIVLADVQAAEPDAERWLP